jgi:translation initiation factor 1 (eIF-1/SUI1)
LVLFRKDGTKVVTRIKNISGDIDTFVRELRIVLSLPQPANQLPSYDAIRFRAGNMVEIQGHRAAEIRRWLGQLGF